MKYIVKNLREIDKSILDEFYEDIYEDKKNSLKKDNYLSIYAEYLLSELLKEEGIKYRYIEVEKINKKRPYIKNHDLYYSISYSNDYVIVAIHNTPIGVDIHEIRNDKINPRVLSKDEVKYNYLDILSLKISYLKCKGLGTKYIKDITFNLDGNIIESNHKEYDFIQYKGLPGYVISICLKKK